MTNISGNESFRNLPIPSQLGKGDLLLIVPPLQSIELAPYGVCLLQAVSKQAGFQVNILYANMMFANFIGTDRHHKLCWNEGAITFGEALFSYAAHGLHPFHNEALLTKENEKNGREEIWFKWDRAQLTPKYIEKLGFNHKKLSQLESDLANWMDALADIITCWSYPFVGVTCSYAQINASLSILSRVKQLNPEITTLIGGSNCLGDMANGIAKLAPYIDYVFAGESEKTLIELLSGSYAPTDKIVQGVLNQAMDKLPIPDFEDYLVQLKLYMPNWETLKESIQLPYETSRGCWWGVKHHCTFCSEPDVPYRYKSPTRVIDDLIDIAEKYNRRDIFMIDNIMAHQYFRTLLPELAKLPEKFRLFYEVKSNLSLKQVMLLREAGVVAVQPGIESFSTPLLKIMKKGVKAYQNIQLLRYARATNLDLFYWLLWGFPGDKAEWYEDTISIIHLIPHLQPPDGLGQLILLRNSPYLNKPNDFGISDVRASEIYQYVMPKNITLESFLDLFSGQFDSEIVTNTDLQQRLESTVENWVSVWRGTEPLPFNQLYRSYTTIPEPTCKLHISLTSNGYILEDTRGLPDTEQEMPLKREQVVRLLAISPYTKLSEQLWAVEQKLAVVVDGWYIPLATAKPELIRLCEAETSYFSSLG